MPWITKSSFPPCQKPRPFSTSITHPRQNDQYGNVVTIIISNPFSTLTPSWPKPRPYLAREVRISGNKAVRGRFLRCKYRKFKLIETENTSIFLHLIRPFKNSFWCYENWGESPQDLTEFRWFVTVYLLLSVLAKCCLLTVLAVSADEREAAAMLEFLETRATSSLTAFRPIWSSSKIGAVSFLHSKLLLLLKQ